VVKATKRESQVAGGTIRRINGAREGDCILNYLLHIRTCLYYDIQANTCSISSLYPQMRLLSIICRPGNPRWDRDQAVALVGSLLSIFQRQGDCIFEFEE
jgi:hypothetical protein